MPMIPFARRKLDDPRAAARLANSPCICVLFTSLLGFSVAWGAESAVVSHEQAGARRAFGGIQPVLSPDGRQIAMSFQGAICRMPSQGGALTRLTREEGWDVEPAWSPDGQRIAYINASNFSVGQLRVTAMDNGMAIKL